MKNMAVNMQKSLYITGKRFLDDCFIPWTKSKSDLLELNNLLNNLHPDIKFTMEYSNVQQPFLDVLD